MIACHDAISSTPCREVPEFGTDGPETGFASDEIACLRTVEILTVLNDVFDSFGLHEESDVFKAAVPA